MPADPSRHDTDFFDAASRVERVQLLSLLLRNAAEVPYLRGPAGAGKTRFARHLEVALRDEYEFIRVDSDDDPGLQRLFDGLASRGGDDGWDDTMLQVGGDRPSLIIADDVDQVDAALLQKLSDVRAAGHRLLLIGNGRLPDIQRDWELQFVDLGPLTEAETHRFANQFLAQHQINVSPHVLQGLYRASNGLPGMIIESLLTLPGEESMAGSISRRPLLWLGGILLITLVAATLLFQEDVNTLFDTPVVADAVPAKTAVTAFPVGAGSDDAAGTDEDLDQPPGPSDTVRRHDPAVSTEEPGTAPEAAAIDDVLDAVMAEAIEAAQTDEAAATPGLPPLPEKPTGDGPESDVPQKVVADELVADRQLPHQSRPPAARAIAADKTEPEAQPEHTGQLPTAESAPSGGAANQVASPAKPTPRSTDDNGWIQAQEPKAYTLQLVGARDRASIARYITRNKVAMPYAIFQRPLNGRPWYSLVAGVYPDRNAAIAARSRLSSSLNREGVWPRTFASIQEMTSNQ